MKTTYLRLPAPKSSIDSLYRFLETLVQTKDKDNGREITLLLFICLYKFFP